LTEEVGQTDVPRSKIRRMRTVKVIDTSQRAQLEMELGLIYFCSNVPTHQ
jgi:hypothetical protein